MNIAYLRTILLTNESFYDNIFEVFSKLYNHISVEPNYFDMSQLLCGFYVSLKWLNHVNILVYTVMASSFMFESMSLLMDLDWNTMVLYGNVEIRDLMSLWSIDYETKLFTFLSLQNAKPVSNT